MIGVQADNVDLIPRILLNGRDHPSLELEWKNQVLFAQHPRHGHMLVSGISQFPSKARC